MLERSPSCPLEKSNRSFRLSKIHPRSDSSEIIVKLLDDVSERRLVSRVPYAVRIER